jgi:Type I restriction enzyme R protein N terminus (HSDR_N)
MSITTTTPPEAELEARITGTLQRIFPGTTDLHAQRRFKLRLGHAAVEGGTRNYVDGRADILVYQGESPLAVLELKREGLALTDGDAEQGASYALLARAPLVVVSNGSDTRLFQTHDMARIEGTSIDASELARRVSRAAVAARSSVLGAINKLLGTDLASAAVAAINAAELGELTGEWTSSERFVGGFLVPRSATAQVRTIVREGLRRMVLVSGPPLCGKSSVLRELADTAHQDGWDVLFLDGSSCSEGVFRRIANVLATQFSWPATPDEARSWLRQVASQPDRRLVLCIDSLPALRANLTSELDELATGAMGACLHVVLAVDEGELEQLTLKANRREKTRLGRNSSQVEVGHYDDEEFTRARRCLAELGGGLILGCQYAPELRAPWVLRAAVAQRLEDRPEGLTAVLPPLLGKEMFVVAANRFDGLGDVGGEFASLARIYVEELGTHRHHGDRLASLYVFAISGDSMKKSMDREAIRDLVAAGLIQASASHSGEVIYVVRVPALFGHAVGERLARLLQRKVLKNPEDAAKWLVGCCANMPLGDAIGAYAVDRALAEMSAPNLLSLLNSLLGLPPARRAISPGSKFVGLIPSVGLIDFEIDQDGTAMVRQRSTGRRSKRFELGELPFAVEGLDGWLILSQLRPWNVLIRDQDGELWSIAAWLLMEIGTCPVMLRRPSKELEDFHTHDIDGGEMSCMRNGIAEPVTWAIAELLGQDVPGVDRDAWVHEAAASDSLPLINRLGQALSHLANVDGTSEWAEAMLQQKVRPAMRKHPQFH